MKKPKFGGIEFLAYENIKKKLINYTKANFFLNNGNLIENTSTKRC